jgi:hypothetical protein
MSRSSRKKRRVKAQSSLGRWARNSQLAAHFDVTPMTIWRWQNNPALNFPPSHAVNGISYTDLDEVDRWMRSQPIRRGRPSKAQNTNQEAAI